MLTSHDVSSGNTLLFDVHSKPLGLPTVLVTREIEDLAKALHWPINSKNKLQDQEEAYVHQCLIYPIVFRDTIRCNCVGEKKNHYLQHEAKQCISLKSHWRDSRDAQISPPQEYDCFKVCNQGRDEV